MNLVCFVWVRIHFLWTILSGIYSLMMFWFKSKTITSEGFSIFEAIILSWFSSSNLMGPMEEFWIFLIEQYLMQCPCPQNGVEIETWRRSGEHLIPLDEAVFLKPLLFPKLEKLIAILPVLLRINAASEREDETRESSADPMTGWLIVAEGMTRDEEKTSKRSSRLAKLLNLGHRRRWWEECDRWRILGEEADWWNW